MKNYSSIFLSLFLIFSFCIAVPAQETKSSAVNKNETVAASAVARLQQKILLSDKQTGEIKAEVAKYIGEKSNLEDSSKLFAKIVPILDSRQKIKFEIIRNDWWTNMVKELNK